MPPFVRTLWYVVMGDAMLTRRCKCGVVLLALPVAATPFVVVLVFVVCSSANTEDVNKSATIFCSKKCIKKATQEQC